MPSPLAHGCLVLVASACSTRKPGLELLLAKHRRFFLLATIALLWAPDVDFALHWILGASLLAHGGVTHSLVAGVGFASAYLFVLRLVFGTELPLSRMFLIALFCAWSHPLMDLATLGGRGIMLLWPFSTERYSVVPLFYGVRHSTPFAFHLHAITLLTEAIFVAGVWWTAQRIRAKPTQ